MWLILFVLLLVNWKNELLWYYFENVFWKIVNEYPYKYNNDYTIIQICITAIIIESNIEDNFDLSQFYNFKCR